MWSLVVVKEQPKWMTAFARSNRHDPTKAERILWAELRRSTLGVRFRRQDPVGPYIADFSCRTHRLIVEVDGDSHDDPARDRVRDLWFQDHGWFVLRFDDHDIFEGLNEAVELIMNALEDPTAVVNPLNLPD